MMELASAFEPPEMTGAVGTPVDFEKPLKRNALSVAYASAEYEIRGPEVTRAVEVLKLVTVVVVPVEVAYRKAKTPTTIIRTTITARATPEKVFFPVYTLGSVMQAIA